MLRRGAIERGDLTYNAPTVGNLSLSPSGRTSLRSLVVLLAVGLGTACGGAEPGTGPLVVFAAASLRDLAGDFAAELERRQPVEVVYNFAGSNTLAQQIHAAPGADVFLSADEAWVDFLDREGRTVAGSRQVFLSNRLVLIGHRDANLAIDDLSDLAAAVAPEGGKRGTAPEGGKRGTVRFLAVADPQAVPAGRYARAALERVEWHGGSVWSALAGRIAPTLDVRAALALVESDPEILGVVYSTDAMTSEKVQVLHELAPGHAPIRYCATLIAGGPNPELGRRFLDLLISPAARELAERHGFTAMVPAGRAEHAPGGGRTKHAPGGGRTEHAPGGGRTEHAPGGGRTEQMSDPR